jgi:DNA end-binding protein Ku
MAAAARLYWTGFLKLSLVTIAVRLYSATTEKERIHFHQIHEPSGERIRYQTVVRGLGPVERSEIVKGYEYQKGRYVTIEPADLEKLRLETTDTIDIAEFVETGAFPPVYLDNPYYLIPDGSLAERVIA